jgi:hypothetical protein
VKSGLAHRYWSTLTGASQAPTPTGRGRTGYNFGRRYVAALLGVSLPPHRSDTQKFATRASWMSAPSTSPRQPAVTGSPPQQLRLSTSRHQARRRLRWELAAGLIGAAACLTMVMMAVVRISTPSSVGAPPPATSETGPLVGGAEPTEQSTDADESRGAGESPIRDFAFDLWDGESVPQCTALEGWGWRPPEGDTVLTVQPYGNDVMSYATRLEFDGDVWRADNVVIGAPDDNGQPYELRVYAVSPDVADQLVSSGTWSGDIPGRLLARLDVVRVNDPGYC